MNLDVDRESQTQLNKVIQMSCVCSCTQMGDPSFLITSISPRIHLLPDRPVFITHDDWFSLKPFSHFPLPSYFFMKEKVARWIFIKQFCRSSLSFHWILFIKRTLYTRMKVSSPSCPCNPVCCWFYVEHLRNLFPNLLLDNKNSDQICQSLWSGVFFSLFF